MNTSKKRKIFCSFLRPELDNGPSISILKHQHVGKRHGSLTNKKPADILATANTLPGLMITKILDYEVTGVNDALVAVVHRRALSTAPIRSPRSALSSPQLPARQAHEQHKQLGALGHCRDVGHIGHKFLSRKRSRRRTNPNMPLAAEGGR